MTLEWTSSTIVERSCNWGKNDFSYFGIGSYSNNAFLVVFNKNINPNLNQENVQVGKISVNTIDKGIKSKKNYIVNIGHHMELGYFFVI